MGCSSSSASDGTSAFILTARYASWEEAVHMSLCRPRTSSKFAGFCKTNSAVSIMAMHLNYTQEVPEENISYFPFTAY
jgi:hypothetical protein